VRDGEYFTFFKNPNAKNASNLGAGKIASAAGMVLSKASFTRTMIAVVA
jgi:hypothetical protein